jgi:hypothetical protein
MTEMPEGVDESRISVDDSRSQAVCTDFRAAIDDLELAYPDKKCIIMAMFRDEDGDMNSKIVFRDVAERSGESPAKVSRFYRNVVQPFFIERFKGDRP